jgi:vacuolar-type H+-ATPase subunit F/Vma7
MTEQEVFIIGDEDIVLMFGLLGLNGIVVEDQEIFLKEFNKLIKRPRVGMVIIGLPLSNDLVEYLLNFKLYNKSPFIFILPDIFRPNIENDDYILNKIYDAISDII